MTLCALTFSNIGLISWSTSLMSFCNQFSITKPIPPDPKVNETYHAT